MTNASDATGQGPFDLQINGYAGVDFNAPDLCEEDAAKACARLKTDGVSGILATLITDSMPALEEKIRRWASWIKNNPAIGHIVPGLHIEGPFLNPTSGYAGAHNAPVMQPARIATAEKILEAGAGLIRILTLAPEQDQGGKVTRWLSSKNVIVAAGHTDASLDQLQESIDCGLKLFTHLGNGCPPVLPRHDNIIHRVLHLADQLWISLIPDGIHLPPFVLSNFLKILPPDRVIAVTDAMAAAGLGAGRYTLAGREVVVDQQGAARYPENPVLLAGSAATMPRIAALLTDQLGLDDSRIIRLTRTNPMNLLASAGLRPG